jgi:hypothetical protein
VSRARINSGVIDYLDLHLSHVARMVWEGFFGHLDLADRVIEADIYGNVNPGPDQLSMGSGSVARLSSPSSSAGARSSTAGRATLRTAA